MKYLFVLAAVSASVPLVTSAQTERDLDSHVHGSATLNVAVADSSVFIELETPWNNLVGFEHAPKTEEQQDLMDSALSVLNDPEQLFLFDGGDCALTDVALENDQGENHDDDHHDEHAEDHDDEHHDEHAEKHDDDHHDEHTEDHDDDEHHDEHAEKHDDEHHDEHAEKHDDEHHDEHAEKHDDEHHDEHAEKHDDDHHDEHAEATHSAVLVNYSFACQNIDKLSTIKLALFSVWPGFEELDVQLIGDNGQAFIELDPQNTVLDIESVK